MALNAAIKVIEDAIVQRLINTAIPGVNGIVFSRELRSGTLQPPYLHIFPTPSPINATVGLVLSEEWTFAFEIMGVAASYSSEDQDQARQIALLAATAIFFDPIGAVSDRCLGGAVDDIIRLVWHADFTKELPTEQLFGAAVEFAARKILKEI